jgi:dTDP-4-dehydrorhamnose 3,5-epimerase
VIVNETGFHGLLVIEPKIFRDDRGFFLETFQDERYREAGIGRTFVQDNLSRSSEGVVRGLHFQKTRSQGKLVTCLKGKVLDVVVDLRVGSETRGKVFSIILDSDKRNQLWIPPGFAHGFSVLSENADFFYKCTDHYAPNDEGGILWSDPDLAIDWLVSSPIVSAKDQNLPGLREVLG